MIPSTPKKSHSRQISSLSTPATPPSAYVLASETFETPTRGSSGGYVPNLHYDQEQTTPTQTQNFSLHHAHDGDMQGPPSGSSSGSYNSNSTSSELEVLENDEETDEEEVLFDEGEGEGMDGEEVEAGEPLVARGRRRRKRWDDGDKRETSLIELVPPLVLAHPLPLLPLLALLPYNFLPAGVVFFIPIICVLAALSACAHIVIVYLAWYLKVSTFEDVFAKATGEYGRYGRWGGTAFVICSTVGLLVGWLGTLHPILEPAISSYLPSNAFFSSRIPWTILGALTLLPSLLPSRMTRSLRRAPIVIALLFPVVAFLIIGRTVEIVKAAEEFLPIGEDSVDQATEVMGHLARRKFGLAGGSSAGAGLTTLTVFLTPHLNTLPIHSTLPRANRSSFPIPCLATSLSILLLSLPLALVPYYLLPALSTDLDPGSEPGPISPTSRSGVFARLPSDDAWVNVARLCMCILILGSANLWILRARDAVLKAMHVDRGERVKAGRWVGLGIWSVVLGLSCLGGWVAEKVELIGVLGTIAVGWFLPSLFFIITFHLRSPLSIVFPSHAQPPPPPPTQTPAPSIRHNRTDSLQDPSTDHLLARKERQLQKRRLGRRLWQDLIVYVGILPVGCVTLFWTLGSLVGIW